MADLILPSRRRFLFGAGALLAAPAIVRVASLMPVSVIEPEAAPAPDWTTARITIACSGPLKPGEFVTLSGYDFTPEYNGTWRVVGPNTLERTYHA